MARRKDHSPAELKQRIHAAAKKLIESKGLAGLTARALATRIGYTPGTIYNVYRDMDALITDVNYTTLQELYQFSLSRLEQADPGYASVRALADAYIDFAHMHERAWRTLFIETNRSAGNTKLPVHYRKCLSDLFEIIENTLKNNMNMSSFDAAQAARLLWAALHGVTFLMLDGRLNLIGISDPHDMVDDLLRKYLGISGATYAR